MAEEHREFPWLFKPAKIGGLTLKNRIVLPSLTTNYANHDGTVNSRTVDYYTARAKGGAGLVMVETACIEYPRGKALINQLDISKEASLPGLRQLAQVIKDNGARAGLQLHHAGLRRHSCETIDEAAIAPSRIYPVDFDVPDEMSLDQIQEIIKKFVQAAVRAKEAGYEAVEVHGAHGYLLGQFLSPLFNRRTDAYGGSLPKRLRIMQEIVDQTRRELGKDYAILCRLSGDEHVQGGLTLEDSKMNARGLEEAGADAIHVSVSSPPPGAEREMMFNVPPMGLPEGAFVHLAAGIKKACKIPVIAVGRIHSPELAEEILALGKADLIAIGRGLLADPEWPNKAAAGRTSEIRPCIACNRCYTCIAAKNEVVCTVNPEVGREGRPKPQPAGRAKRILVLGAGPGGMEASLTASRRGHEVHLWEQGQALGGQLRLAAAPPGKEVIGKLADYFERQVAQSKIQVKIEADCGEEAIRKLAPEVIILAAGSRAEIPRIPGADQGQVVTARQVLAGEVQTGERVLVIGGGTAGCETAHFLSAQGKKVTLIEQLPALAADMEPLQLRLLMPRLAKAGVELMTSTRLLKVTKSGAEAAGLDGQVREIKADTVVMAVQPKANREQFQRLREIAETYVIGDAVSPRSIYEAIFEGSIIGRRV